MFVQGKEYDKIDDVAAEIVTKIVQEYVLGAVKVEVGKDRKQAQLMAAGVALWIFGMSVGLNLFLLIWR